MEGVKTIISLLGDLATFLCLVLRPLGTLAVENLFLRKQLAKFQERKAKPHRPDTPIRISHVLLSRLLNWCDAPVVVQSRTLVRCDGTVRAFACSGDGNHAYGAKNRILAFKPLRDS
jgi:hypothetical protein